MRNTAQFLPEQSRAGFLLIGHRGAMGYEPENTLRSIDKALALGVDAIEIDVHYVDKQLVVIHDSTLERTTNGKGSIYQYRFEQLRALNAGKGEKIPTLDEVLERVNKKAAVNIELKGRYTALPVIRLLQQKRAEGWKLENFLLSSFHYQELETARAHLPQVPLAVLTEQASPAVIQQAIDLSAFSVNPCLECVTEPFVRLCHQQGLKVLVYTVNTKSQTKAMKQIGVNGIFSNYPDRV